MLFCCHAVMRRVLRGLKGAFCGMNRYLRRADARTISSVRGESRFLCASTQRFSQSGVRNEAAIASAR
jgi:hypothetical protein